MNNPAEKISQHVSPISNMDPISVEPEIDSRFAWRHLKPKVRRFVDAYVMCGVIAQAERESKCAAGAGQKLLKKPIVRAAISGRRREMEQLGLIEQAQVLQELKTVAYASPEDLRDPKPTWDHKLRALEMLGRNEKMFTDRVEVTGNVTLSMLVRASYEREKVVDAGVIDTPALPDARSGDGA